MPSKKTIRAAERRARAVELRKLGLTYEQIRAQLDITKQAAAKLVQRAIDASREHDAQTVRAAVNLELERLDDWQVKVAREMQKGKVLQGIDRLLRIAERRAKLLGLDAPTKHAARIAGPEGGPVPVAHEMDLKGMSNAELLGILEELGSGV